MYIRPDNRLLRLLSTKCSSWYSSSTPLSSYPPPEAEGDGKFMEALMR